MNNFYLFLFYILGFHCSLFSQSSFERNYGRTDNTFASPLFIDSSGHRGILSICVVNDSAGNHRDVLLSHFEYNGRKRWEKQYGWEKDDVPTCYEKTSNGWVIAGYTYSRGKGREDWFVYWIDSTGTWLDSQVYGGVKNDRPSSVTVEGNTVNVVGYINTDELHGVDVYLVNFVRNKTPNPHLLLQSEFSDEPIRISNNFFISYTENNGKFYQIENNLAIEILNIQLSNIVNPSFAYISSMLKINDTEFVVAISEFFSTVFVKLNTNGDIIWKNENIDGSIINIHKLPNGNLLLISDLFGSSDLYTLDQDGNELSSVELNFYALDILPLGPVNVFLTQEIRSESQFQISLFGSRDNTTPLFNTFIGPRIIANGEGSLGICELSNGNYLMTAVKEISYNENAIYSDFTLDPSGKLLATYTHDLTNSDYCGPALPTSDGYYVRYCSIYDNNELKSSITAFHIKNGVITKTSSPEKYDFLGAQFPEYQLAIHPLNRHIIVNTVKDEILTKDVVKILVQMRSQDGKTIYWNKIIDIHEGDVHLAHVKVNNNGDIFIIGTYQEIDDAFVIKLNSVGDLIYTAPIAPSLDNLFVFGQCVEYDEQNKLVIAGATGVNSDESKIGYITILNDQQSGNEMNRIILDANPLEDVEVFSILKNNIGYSIMTSIDEYPNYNYSIHDAVTRNFKLISMDNNFETIKEQEFRKGTNFEVNFLSGAEKTSKNENLYTGLIDVNNSAQAYLLKTNDDGIVPINSESFPDIKWEFYPNPIIDRITISYKNGDQTNEIIIKLLNSLGEVIYHNTKMKYTGILTVNLELSHLPAGTFMVQVIDKEVIHSSPFIKK